MLPKVFHEGDAWFVWTADECHAIRESAHILGEQTMPCPEFPQQIKFLSLPVCLTPCEVKYLYEKKLCRLVTPVFHPVSAQEAITDTPDKWTDLVRLHDDTEFDLQSAEPPEVDRQLYLTYTSLREMGFWVLNGERNGCDFVIYRTAPKTCHASAFVWCQRGQLDTLKMIREMRICDMSKKKFLLAFVSNEDKIIFHEITRHKTQ